MPRRPSKPNAEVEAGAEDPPVFLRQRFAPISGGSGDTPTMEINALVISGLDPGAIPGGSTNLPPRVVDGWDLNRLSEGPISIDRRLKGLAFFRHGPPRSAYFVVANDNFASEMALAA